MEVKSGTRQGAASGIHRPEGLSSKKAENGSGEGGRKQLALEGFEDPGAAKFGGGERAAPELAGRSWAEQTPPGRSSCETVPSRG